MSSKDRSDPRTDAELVTEVIARRPEAVLELISRLECVRRILGARNRRMGSPLGPQDLADVVQDTLVVIWRKLPSFGDKSSLDAWIYRISCFELLNAVRRRQRNARLRSSDNEVLESYPCRENHSLERAERIEALHAGLERLEDPEREPIELKHFEELTFSEIAQRLGVSANTAKTRYYRGLRRLLSTLRGSLEEGADEP